MVYMHQYGVDCQLCGDNPNITCTCNKKINAVYIKSVIDFTEEIESTIPIKPKKNRMTRLEKQSMYGGVQWDLN